MCHVKLCAHRHGHAQHEAARAVSSLDRALQRCGAHSAHLRSGPHLHGRQQLQCAVALDKRTVRQLYARRLRADKSA